MCVFLVLSGCARSDEVRVDPSEIPVATQSSGAESAPPQAPEATGPSALTRAGLDAVLREGPGAFLARVEVAPAFSAGRFVGFRLVRARDLVRWNAAGADLHPGDVLQRVNGISIERPEGVMAVFAALRDAHELRVDVLRDGRPVVVRQPIVDAVSEAP